MTFTIKPIYGEDYSLHWQGPEWTNKRVMDIGADYGSTAFYFLERGASIVYAVEGDPRLYRQLEENARAIGNIIPIFMFVDSAKQFSELFLQYRPDIVKIDCEGCEKHLVDVDVGVLASIPEFIVETHTERRYRQVNEKLRNSHRRTWVYRYMRLKIICSKSHFRSIFP